MIAKKETALEFIKKAKYGVIPLYILLVLFYFIMGLKESSFGWVLLGLGIGLLWSAVLPLTLFTGLLWVQYILEGYVKGFFKWVRCAGMLLASLFGILYSCGWYFYAFKRFYFSTGETVHINGLFEGYEVAVWVAILYCLLYPILLYIESRFRKEHRFREQYADLLNR